MRLAIVGATGMVGRTMLKVLQEKKFFLTELILVASEKSVGEKIVFSEKTYKIHSLSELIKAVPDVALFSAGREVSRIWAPKLAKKGCKIIDNSSYWRMSSKHKLIVPEINGKIIKKEDMIIANPNCSTIQLAVVLSPLHNEYNVKRAVVSTYQSVTGTGREALKQLKNEEKGITTKKVYSHQIYQNVLPHCDVFEENGYTKEEMKLTNEIKKIIDNNIKVTATAVRVPVVVGHSESVNITFEKEFELQKIYSILNKNKGIKITDKNHKKRYPTPIDVHNKDEVFVGRIRRDFSLENTLNLWVVADNLRKGAATNAIQILEYVVKNKLV